MDDRNLKRRAACDTFVFGDGPVEPATALAQLGGSIEIDVYGEGGAVSALEEKTRLLLGAEAAVFLPSGTMAQGATLRVHADAREHRTVLWHATSHLALHELGAHEVLHRLRGRPVGEAHRLIDLSDLTSVAEPAAALLLELPQREIGGQLPEWSALRAQLEWARERGMATHLDGARIWEASAGYGKEPAEIAALFDTAYVSFYKGIGALAGCCVVGPVAVVAQVREWRRRLGGTLYGLWPLAASALALLDERLAEMPARLRHAREIAAALAGVPGVTVVPAVPQVGMMHLLLRVSAESYTLNADALIDGACTWVPPSAQPTSDPETVSVELTVGRATCALPVERVVKIVAALAIPRMKETP